MNWMHTRLCAGPGWARRVESVLIPWGLEGVQLGDDVLEIGPGLGATTRVLAGRVRALSVVELNRRYCHRLRAELGDRVQVVEGDAAALPFPDGRFSAAVCFTMLHHLESPALQDRVLAEIARVLAPRATFAGTDSLGGSMAFRLIHIGDTLTLIDPDGFPARLIGAGFDAPTVEVADRSMRFRARRRA